MYNRSTSATDFTHTLALVVMSAVALCLPVLAQAEPKTPEYAGQSPNAEIAKQIEADESIGIVILLQYDGTIKTYTTNTGEVSMDDVTPPDDLIGEGTMEISIYESSPGCVTCKQDGQTITICD
jgi:hypothetical protein